MSIVLVLKGIIILVMLYREEVVKNLTSSFSQTSHKVEEDNQEVKNCNSWQMYLTNAPPSCTSNQERCSIPNTSAAFQDTGITISRLSGGEPHPFLSATQVDGVFKPTVLHSEMELLGEDHCEEELTSATSPGASGQTQPEDQNYPVYPPSVCHSRVPFTSAASRYVSQQASVSCVGTTAPVQPLLLTGTFPYNMQGIEVCPFPLLCQVTCSASQLLSSHFLFQEACHDGIFTHMCDLVGLGHSLLPWSFVFARPLLSLQCIPKLGLHTVPLGRVSGL